MEEDKQMSFDFKIKQPPADGYDHQCDGADIFKKVTDQLPDPSAFFNMQPYDLDETYHFVLGQLGRKGVFTIEQRDYLMHYLWIVEDHLMEHGML